MIKRFWKKLEWGDRINFLVLVVTIIGLIITSVFTSINFRKIGELNYELNSLNFQPRIKIVGDPIINDIEYDSIRVAFRDSSVSQFADTATAPIFLEIDIDFSVNSTAKITNVGNSLGKVFLYGVTDSIPKIREYLTGKTNIDNLVEKFIEMPKFLENELLPEGQDTLELDLNAKINFVNDKLFTLHYFILYKNELGQIYDTYFKVKYQLRSFPIRPLRPLPVRDVPTWVRQV